MKTEAIPFESLEKEMEKINEAKKNPERFEYLYETYYERIFRFIYKRIDDESLVEDMTSQVFFNAMTKLYKYTFKGVPFSAWLYKIALNELNMYFRKKTSIRIIDIDSINTPILFEDVNETNNEENIEKLMIAMLNLRKPDADMLELRYFEQLSFKEIAEIYSITENNAKVKVYRAIETLKHEFQLK